MRLRVVLYLCTALLVLWFGLLNYGCGTGMTPSVVRDEPTCPTCSPCPTGTPCPVCPPTATPCPIITPCPTCIPTPTPAPTPTPTFEASALLGNWIAIVGGEQGGIVGVLPPELIDAHAFYEDGSGVWLSPPPIEAFPFLWRSAGSHLVEYPLSGAGPYTYSWIRKDDFPEASEGEAGPFLFLFETLPSGNIWGTGYVEASALQVASTCASASASEEAQRREDRKRAIEAWHLSR